MTTSPAAGVPNPASGPLTPAVTWPVRSGGVPRLAERFSSRPETGPDLAQALRRSSTVVLTPRARRVGAGSSQDWLRCSGKTQLAAYFAETQWRERAVDLLVWIDASSTTAVLSGYVEAAAAVTGARQPGNAEAVAASFLGWLAQASQRWLVVLDDLSDAAILNGLWPAGPAGRVLVTAASSQVVSGLRDALVLELGPFSPREAMSYLVGRLSADPDQRRGAIDLADSLDCQPVALAHATAVIATSWLTCTDYREVFHRRSAALTPPGAAPPPAAAVTWTLSVDHAEERLPGGAAPRCLAIAAMLDGRGFPATTLTASSACAYIAGDRGSVAGRSAAAGTDSGGRGAAGKDGGEAAAQAAERARMAVTVLEQAGLITIDRNAEPPAARTSPILQRAVRAAMPADMLEQAAQAAATALLECWPDGDQSSGLSQSLRSSAACLRRATGRLLWAEDCHPLLLRAGRSLDEASLTGAAEEYWTELAAVADQVFGPGHPDAMQIVERLASAYLAAGRPGDAVTRYQRLVANWTAALGPDHPRTLQARVSLGRVEVSARLFADAITVLTSALGDCERAFGSGDPQCTLIRDEVAAGYRAAGQRADATRMYRLILSERERSLGALHPDTLASRERLAETYLADNRLKDAFAEYKRVIADRQRSQGRDHPDALRASGALAAAYYRAGKMAPSVELYEQVYAGLGRVLGPDHPDALAATVDLARSYAAVGRLTDASRLCREALERGGRVLAPADPLLQAAQDGLAAITAAVAKASKYGIR